MENEQTTRREFLRHTAAAGGCLIAGSTSTAQANPKNSLSADRMGVLVDTTVCVGCRACEWACKNAHGIPTQPYHAYEDRSVFGRRRRPTHSALTVVNEFPAGDATTNPIDVKSQCMHCDHPTCVSACIVGAFTKQEDGSVLWDGGKCIGCRYCMVACPFQIPSFEYDKALQPDIAKCDFCVGRTSRGMLPACVDICPVGAMTYGPRADLIKVAREKMDRYPGRYVRHLYGEFEAGGTSWLYMASRDFASLGFPDVGTRPMPGTTESIQHGIFAYFMPPVMLYALLGALMWITKKRREIEKEGGE